MQAALVLSLAASAVAASKVSVCVDRFFESGTESTLKANVLVKFNVDIAALEAGAMASTAPRQYVFDFLKEAAEKNEAKLAGVVPADATVTSLFIGGAASISGVTKATLDALTALNVVTYVDLNANDFSRPEVLQGSASTEEGVAVTNEWGVDAVGGPEIWKYTTGQGVVVGSIDTGAINTHEAIKHNHRAENGWFDPYNKTPAPWDSDGHGAHTIGTMVGSHGIGVAPGAKWIACMGLYKKSGTGEALLQCAQFMLCPSKPDGTGADCSKGPHVVNNSWGADAAYHPWFEAAVAAWKAAGIIPVFANGNKGPKCGTVGDKLAFFSSKGPQATNGPAYVKPDISAPGFFTRSVSHLNNTGYMHMAGTSMAAPHVAGVVALLKGVDATLTYDAVYKYLTATTDQAGLHTTEPEFWQLRGNDTLPGSPNCGGVSDSEWPNNRFGHGHVNVGTILRDGKLNDNRRPTC
ncbi:hypothetical protein DYB37_008968 [Aphanomyces astaci]|uniref:subtilisin n=1 Tax=Aphanomyces astaci TaxID=112090 RepID=A0A3R7BNC0_APHAT|nr:hypothetical protein DYB35_008511 [Aphanomyces astaci]RHZ29260.1 hypothetical protein DYB37_008968 [Aphanomyces astaci]